MVRAPQSYSYHKQWKADRVRGLPKRTTGPERAQAHVQDLISRYGVSARGIAEAAGVSGTVVSDLNRGRCPGLKRTTETSILAVRIDDIYNRPSARGSVPAIGTRRRLQALMAMGWRHEDLTEMLGFRSANLNNQGGDWISASKVAAVKALYDRLWNVQGPAPATSLARVANAGYAPPLAWDDDSIDDPDAKPDFGAKVAGRGRPQEGAIPFGDTVVENVEFLLQDGATWPAIVDRLSTTHDALDRSLHRAGRSDLITRAKSMTERLAFARAS